MKFFMYSILLLTLFLVPQATLAQPESLPCSDRPTIMNYLSKQHHEAPVSMGLSNNGTMFEVFTSKFGETWSIIITAPTGNSCLISAGESWQNVPQKLPKKGIEN